MKSWRTTALGVIAGLMIILPEIGDLISDPENFSITIVMSGLSAMGIGWFARDNNVTSEQAGARK